MSAPGGDDLVIRRFEGTHSQDKGRAVCEQCERDDCRVWTLEKETAGLRLGSKEEIAGELSVMCMLPALWTNYVMKCRLKSVE